MRPVANGFQNNFNLGTLVLARDTVVQLLDETDNAVGAGTEALYLDSLIVPVGCTLLLNGLQVYVRASQVEGAVAGGTILQVPDSGPVGFATPTPGSISAVGELDEWEFFGRAGRTIGVFVNPSNGVEPAPVPPFLTSAQVSLLDAANNVLATAATASGSSALVSLDNITLPADGTYRVQVRAPAGNSSSTGNYVITVADVTADVGSLNLNQRVTGNIENAFTLDRWNFSAMAGQQIQFDLINASTSALVFDLVDADGNTVFTGLHGDSEPLILPTSGSYTLTAHGSAGQFGTYAFELEELSQTELILETPYSGNLVGAGQSQLFRIHVPQAAVISLHLDDADDSHHNELYAKFGSPPTRSSYDARYSNLSAADQEILIPRVPAGTLYALLYSAAVASPSTFTLTASAADVRLLGLTPDRYSTDAIATLTLTGAGFDSTTSVSLIAADSTVYPISTVEVDSQTRITAVIDLHGVPQGTYSVRVSKAGGGSSELPGALNVTPVGEAHLEAKLILPDNVGRHQLATLFVEYTNTGDVELLNPLLTLRSTDPDDSDKPFFTLGSSRRIEDIWTFSAPDGLSYTADLPPVDVLAPGQAVRVPVYYSGLQAPWDFNDSAVEFGVFIASTSGVPPIDWALIRDTLRPPGINADAWAAIIANAQVQTGVEWSDYNKMLSDNARYLRNLGIDVVSQDQLWALELLQANGLSPLSELASAVDVAVETPGLSLSFGRSFGESISSRYEMGPLGRGWAVPWQTALEQDADGSVTILSAGGSRRRFQPDSRRLGVYFSEAGDYAKLAPGDGGTFTLREPNGFVTAFRADGKLDFVQDANSNRITAAYAANRLSSLTHSAGQSLAFAYNGAGLIASVTSSEGHHATYAYDAANQHLLAVTGIDGLVTRYTYSTGQGIVREHALLSEEFPNGTHQFFAYDSQGRLESTSRDGNADRVTFAYNSNGKVTVTDATGAKGIVFFDDRGLVARVDDPLAQPTYSTIDENFNLTKITAATGADQSFGYDKQGNLTQFTDALGQTTRFTYGTALQRLTSLTDARGHTTRYSYDARGNLTATTYADGSVERVQYDAAGNPIGTTNRRNQPINYTYDTAGRVTRQTFADGSHADFLYDGHGNLLSATDARGATSFEYDSADRLTKVTSPNGRFLSYTYDSAGRRSSMTDQSGFATHYNYDSLGRLARLTDASGNTIVSYGYDSVGRLARKDQGNGTFATFEYDVAGQLTQLVNHAPEGSVNSRFDYEYDRLGRRTRMGTLDGAWTYSYDDLGQLTHAVFASTNPAVPSQDLSYVYAALGNRVTTIENGVTTAYAANNLNEYTSVGTAAFGYDADGNLLSQTGGSDDATYSYDVQNRLVQVVTSAGTWQYEYDVFGNRIATVHNGQRTEYLLDPTGLVDVVGEYDGSGNVLAHYAHGLGLASRFDTSGTPTFYDFDAIGSTAGVTNTTGNYVNRYRYLPFGENIASTETIANPFEFVGQFGVTNEDNGLDFMRARFYDTGLGRFNGIDPLGIRSGTANLYGYVGNMPTSFVDPSGLKTGLPQLPPIWDTPYFPPRPDGSVVTTDTTGNSNDPNPERTQESQTEQDQFNAVQDILDFFYNPIPEYFDLFTPTPFGSEPDPNPTNGPSLSPFKFAKPPTTPSEPAGEGSSGVAGAIDPNQKVGPAGFGEASFVRSDSVFPYRIDFENDAKATAPAQRVDVTDQLSPNLDWNTLEFTEAGFGDVLLSVPANSQHFETTVPLNFNGQDFEVQILLDFNAATGRLFTQFLSVDPLTSLPPDVLTGFLPPEDGTGRGQGHFNYTINPKPNLPTGTQITNIAIIQFDGGEIIATNQVDPHDPTKGTDPTREAHNTLDSGTPTSSVTALPTITSTASFTVSWSGQDDMGGSGIAKFDVFAGIDNEPLTLWLDDTADTSATFTGEVGHTYHFYSVATDNVGHVELAPAQADASTTVAGAVSVQVNASHVVVITDLSGTPNDLQVTRDSTRGLLVITSSQSELFFEDSTQSQSVVEVSLLGLVGVLAQLGEGADHFDLGTVALPCTVNGGDGNDSLTGGDGGDSLDGGAGNDSLDGGIGNDVLTGGLGTDSLVGGTGTDTLRETADLDMTLTSTSLVSSLAGQVSTTDVLNGFEAAALTGGVGANRIDASTFAVGASLGVTLIGAAGNDVLTAGIGRDSLVGDDGNDTINAGSGNDTVLAGLGRDSITGSAGFDNRSGGDGIDTVFGGTSNDTIDGGLGNDVINGQDGDDSILGGEGNDKLTGDVGNDILRGGLGNDTLKSDAGNDQLFGDEDNDSLIGGDGTDRLEGGAGLDVLRGDKQSDTLLGGTGDDSLVGGADNDSLDGGDDNDTVNGDFGNDTLAGGNGNDRLSGFGGDDQFDGGLGTDFVTETGDTDVVVIGANFSSALFGTDTTVNVERLNLSGGSADNRFDARAATIIVRLFGNDGNDTLYGGSKIDSIVGGNGDDVLSGGGSNDVIDGGAGSDFFSEKADANVTITGLQVVSVGISPSVGTGTETLVGIERIALVGGVGANTLNASASSVPVILLGGIGNDTLIGSDFNDGLIGGHRVDSATGTDSLTGGSGADTFDNDTADTASRVTDGTDLVIANVFASPFPTWLDLI